MLRSIASLLDSFVDIFYSRDPSIPETNHNSYNTDMHDLNQIESSRVLDSFIISDDDLRKIKLDILKEFELGLKSEETASIKMLITYVRELSRGNETGSYLALDLGGTHFRVLLVEMINGKPKVAGITMHDIPKELYEAENGQDLFDYIAHKLLEFVQVHKLKRRRISLGFTFSFPCKQYGLTQSVLVKWNKGFNVGNIVGTDIVIQLKNALKRQLSGLVEAYIDVVAVINDSTGTLVACSNTNKDCRIGLIVGTGFNACYMERLENCEKWPANYNNPKQVIINCEWGAMGDNRESRPLDVYRNEFDRDVDENSINPMEQTFEKMVSGMYIGELFRLALLKLYNSQRIFNDSRKPIRSDPRLSTKVILSTVKCARSDESNISNNKLKNKLKTKDIINGKHLSLLAKDELSNSTIEAKKIVQLLDIKNYTDDDLNLMIQVANRVITRSAHLVAVGISALLQRIHKSFTVIGYDGSVVKHHPYFLKLLKQKCKELTPGEFGFEFLESSDGSGIGAAVVAAALHKERRPLYVVKQGRLYEMHCPPSRI